MPGRTYSANSEYRYGFNGKENDKETNTQDYGLRMYDPRIGKFLSVDPLTMSYPFYSPYTFAGNKPIWATDLDGAEEKKSNSFIDALAYLLYLFDEHGSDMMESDGHDRPTRLGRGTEYAIEHYTNVGLMVQGHFEMQRSFTSGAKGSPTASKTIVNELGFAKSEFTIASESFAMIAAYKKLKPVLVVNKSAPNTFNAVAEQAIQKIKAATQNIKPLDKIGRRKAYAEEVFKGAGKSGNELDNLMGTVDFSRAVKEKVLNVGDKVYRFERFNAKGGSEMHFFTDAHGADGGATGVGFKVSDGYKLVTYEVTQKTTVMESSIKNMKGNKQYFSTDLQKSIKKISEE